MGLIDDLGGGPVALDTAPIIYYVEQNRRFMPVLEPLFAAIANGAITAVTSEVTLLEVLVIPYRAGNHELANQYETILSGSRGLHLVPLNRDLVRAAARIRALSGMKTPDAFQLAAALATGCSALITNDRAFRTLGNMVVLQLSSYA